MNKPPWQQQQDQMRKQQQDMWAQQQQRLRQQQMQAEWARRQQEKAKAESGNVSSKEVSPPLPDKANEKFIMVETEVGRLRQELQKGRMSVQQVKDRLKDLIIQDDSGNFWTVGFETWQWYRFDGANWVRATPYRSSAPGQSMTVKSSGHPFIAILCFLVFLAITLTLSGLIGNAVYNIFDRAATLSYFAAIITLIIGLIISINLTRKIWRGK
jgi:hypothetical protein